MAARPSPLVKRSASVAVGGGRIALVADTHGAPHPRTTELLRKMRPDAILHAGDIGDLGVLDELGAIAPTLAVRGNIDGVDNDLPDELAIDLCEGESTEPIVRIYLVHIAVYGPKLRADVGSRARAVGASLVVCGHSHVPFIGVDKGLTVMNPGSVGPRRFHLPIVFGVMNVRDGKIALEHVSCETGERWAPNGNTAA
jgi:putative phosphoesterase